MSYDLSYRNNSYFGQWIICHMIQACDTHTTLQFQYVQPLEIFERHVRFCILIVLFPWSSWLLGNFGINIETCTVCLLFNGQKFGRTTSYPELVVQWSTAWKCNFLAVIYIQVAVTYNECCDGSGGWLPLEAASHEAMCLDDRLDQFRHSLDVLLHQLQTTQVIKATKN